MRLKIEPGAVVAASLVYFFSDWTEITATAAAIAVHELGHLAALKAFRLDVCSLRAELSGMCISYRGGGGTAANIIAAAAGPLMGLLYAFASSRVSAAAGEAWFALSSGISCILSLFNLLPIMPLDGGRILSEILTAICGEVKAARVSLAAGILFSAALFAWGVWCLAVRRDITVYAAGAWLLVLQLKDLSQA